MSNAARSEQAIGCIAPPFRLSRGRTELTFVSSIGRMEIRHMEPYEVIVPIFGADGDGDPAVFLGTGSIIADGSILLTAEHVIREWDGPLAIVTLNDLETPFRVDLIESDPLHDLALLRVSGYRPKRPLQVILDAVVGSNRELMTFEYGTTEVVGNQIQLSPATRLGHMTRRLTVETLGPAGVGALELSWPALHGASGAPVLYASNPFLPSDDAWGIVGVVVANAAYHALPAQIVSVLDEKNNIFEEVRYMLPQALAVHISHLRSMYSRAVEPV
jgi:hypothetical protein